MAKLLSLLFLLAIYSSDACCQKVDTINQMLDRLEKDQGFTGVVLIAKEDKILLHKAYGTNGSAAMPMDKNTVFHVASVTKAFTALAIVKLAQDRRLHLQDSIAKYFSPVPAEKSGITIHQLLTHQSGLPQTYAAEGETDPDKAAKKIWKVASEPGSKRFVYSNGNYTLLALIIEKVSGKKWEEYIKEFILAPLGMTNTYFWADKNITGLPEVIPGGKAQKRKRDYGFLGSTGLFTTAVDLQKFTSALRSNVIVHDSSRALWAGRFVRLKSAMPNSTDYYAYGMFLTEGESNSIWLRGNEEAWGVSIVYWLPKSNTSVIVLSNKEKLLNGEKQHSYVSHQIISALKE